MRINVNFWIVWTGFSAFWMILVGYLTISSYIQQTTEYELLAQEGIWVEGEVVNRREEISYDDDDGDTRTTYYAVYRFAIPDETLHGDKRLLEIEKSVSYNIYNQVEKGGNVEIIYAPNTPEIFRQKEAFQPPTRLDLALTFCVPLFGLPFFLLGLYGLWKGW